MRICPNLARPLLICPLNPNVHALSRMLCMHAVMLESRHFVHYMSSKHPIPVHYPPERPRSSPGTTGTTGNTGTTGATRATGTTGAT